MPTRLAHETFSNTEGLPALQSFELATGKGRFEGRQTEEEKGVVMENSINVGRVTGLLASEIEAQRMTLNQAELMAQLGFDLDADEADAVIARLQDDYLKKE